MAWPFSGNSGGNKSADQNLSEERLKILANVAIEQVPFPEQGMLTEEDAWTISPGPTRARINSQQSVPNVAASLAPAPTPVPAAPATVDTSGLERLISSRLDMVEDVLRMVEHRLDEGVSVNAESGGDSESHESDASDEDADGTTGDRIITASGEVVEVGGSSRMMEDDQGQLVELYEAQALAANPFLVAPRSSGSGNQSSTGAPTVAALLLDHMSGMAAVSFTQKAMESGMLTQEEGDAVLAIVQWRNPAIRKQRLKTICHIDNCWCSRPWFHLGDSSTCFEVKSDMGASVGVGGLIIGISMLVVFSMAYQAISLQIESGVDRIEDADEPIPTFSIDDAVIFTGAMVDVTIVDGGAGYSSGGTIEASSGNGGFSATYTTNVTGAITSVVITSHGNYSSLPTLVVNGGGTPTSTASLTAVRGNVLYANLTNTGSTTIAHDDVWMFLDGQNATQFSSVYNPPRTNLWFSGETLFLNWFDTGLPGNERMTLTVGKTTVGHGLW